MYHNPVMLSECIEGLQLKPDGVYVDVTFGGGGHSRAILDRLDSNGHLYAFDQDEDAAANSFDDPRFSFIQQNFRYFGNFIKLMHGGRVDGILADLGVSSHQFDTAEKGFSTRFDGKLDMRMSQSNGTTAADIVNGYSLEDITRILRNYGELNNAYSLANDIVMARENSEISTTQQLIQVVSQHLQIFQALRIEVNQELEVLNDFMRQCPDVLKPGGRLVVMSYHSLEDRLIKNFMKTGNAEGNVEKDFFGNQLTPYNIITRKPITPSDDEIANNNRARSAKLRIAERKPL